MKFCMDILLLKSTPTISCSLMTDARTFEVEQTLVALHFGSWTSHVCVCVVRNYATFSAFLFVMYNSNMEAVRIFIEVAVR